MAAAMNRMGLAALRCPSRISSTSRSMAPIASSVSVSSRSTSARSFTSTSLKQDDSSSATSTSTVFRDSLDPTIRNVYDSLSPQEQKEFEASSSGLKQHMRKPAVRDRLERAVGEASHYVDVNEPREYIVFAREQQGLLAMGEPEPEDFGADDEFAHDDISSHAHGDLEQHREMREYARIAAWEMPLLSKLAKPFVPPAKDEPLRFRYTTYMGESHPAENKVVVEFCTKDLPNLSETQRSKLIKIVGVRYNPDTDIVKISCEMFESQAQNKRYLLDVVDDIIKEAKDPKDTFADIPFDFRHHKPKRQFRFPKEWLMTPERQQQLLAKRQQALLAETQREKEGTLLDGVKVIDRALARAAFSQPQQTPQLQTVAVPAGKKAAKGGRRR
ncbi:hypothetical protein L228DRAFT_263462 [Xylona heveae TC161]|uniref:Small ribosomal subunit protein mS35 mitochondrial conserved domain-containing protein n=1 Tax=Xylona heveae (strain CBS 132557 / TC161) TaxID=1328760 RepID=A0A164ZVJ1_XYLHT|nr:hypothetical protein L228DRAFT_263462 [Xylona heveae TC161]KZF19588.1 hypothetical protein L228DRAFT_263462 [Xylona heveae TC161]